MFKITEYKFKSNINKKIAHFSDIHYSLHFNNNVLDEIVKKMEIFKPDYICITGDIIDNLGVTNNIGNLITFLTNLAKISIVIVGLGNHDTRDFKTMKDNKWYLKLPKSIILLNNSSYEDEFIYFYGLTINNSYYEDEIKNKEMLNKEIMKIKTTNKYNILLFHSPLTLNNIDSNFDLILTGHTHNGLTPHFIKGNFGLITPNHGLFVKNARNSFKINNTTVIVSGGITKLAEGTGLKIFNHFFASDLIYIYLKK